MRPTTHQPRFALMQEQLLLPDLVRTGTRKTNHTADGEWAVRLFTNDKDVFNVKPEFDAFKYDGLI